jgi:hypothetical protein
MAFTSKTVEAINHEAPGLTLAARRVDELPVELGQFAAVLARVRARLGFDQDPCDFVRARSPAKTQR